MHPADCIRAFATLAEEGKDEAAIAHRYGYGDFDPANDDASFGIAAE